MWYLFPPGQGICRSLMCIVSGVWQDWYGATKYIQLRTEFYIQFYRVRIGVTFVFRDLSKMWNRPPLFWDSYLLSGVWHKFLWCVALTNGGSFLRSWRLGLAIVDKMCLPDRWCWSHSPIFLTMRARRCFCPLECPGRLPLLFSFATDCVKSFKLCQQCLKNADKLSAGFAVVGVIGVVPGVGSVVDRVYWISGKFSWWAEVGSIEQNVGSWTAFLSTNSSLSCRCSGVLPVFLASIEDFAGVFKPTSSLNKSTREWLRVMTDGRIFELHFSGYSVSSVLGLMSSRCWFKDW